MSIRIMFLGSLQYDLGQMEITFNLSKGSTIKSVVKELIEKEEFKDFQHFFTESYESTRSVLIFINDQDITVLEGMDSPLQGGDKITFIPVVHGG
jgi:molybdopterin converting factor small subunit